MKNRLSNTSTKSLSYREIAHTFFYKKIKNSIINKEDNLIKNTGEEKAISMLINIFQNNDTVHFFVDNLKSNVSDDLRYEQAVQSFLNRNGKVWLVVKNKIDIEKAFRVYKLLYIYALERPNLVKIAVANNEFKELVKSEFNDNLNNFCVGDSSFIRVEYNTYEYLAKAGYSPELGKRLSKIIESYIKKNNILLKEGVLDILRT